jgi:hypothetical protein
VKKSKERKAMGLKAEYCRGGNRGGWDEFRIIVGVLRERAERLRSKCL